MRASMSCDRSPFGVLLGMLSIGVLSVGVLGCSPAAAPVSPAKAVAVHADHDKHDDHDPNESRPALLNREKNNNTNYNYRKGKHR